MVYTSFDQIIEKVKANPVKKNVAVAGAADHHVIKALSEAREMGITEPVLIGDAAKIRELTATFGGSLSDCRIIDASGPEACGETAVEQIKLGMADFIMKGMADTRDILKPLVRKENNQHTGRIMSHVAVDEAPCFSRLTILTDGGMVPYPTLQEKKDIIINAASVLRALGYERPAAAVLCAAEKVNDKMIETVDAAALAAMSKNGVIGNCDVVGPISYDLAVDARIAKIKGYDCPYCGQFDILVAPTMAAGNLLNKALLLSTGGKMAGVIAGAKIPVVLTSRGSSSDEKFISLALASLMTEQGA